MRHTRRVLTSIAVSVAVALPGLLLRPGDGVAQSSSEIQVLVAPLTTAEGVDSKFGEKVAEEVRKALDNFAGMVPLDWGDIRDQVKQYGLDWKTLTPIEWRQLGGRMQANLVMVGTAQPGGSGVAVTVAFVDPRTGDELPVDDFAVPDDKKHKEAAAHITSGLEEQVGYQRSIVFCQEYLGSNQLDDALRNCQSALAVNPNSARALYLIGRVHMEANDWSSAATSLERVVELNPSNTEALQSLAYTHAQLGNAQRSFELYREYLNFNPDDADVRLNIAFKLATTEAFAEAIAILQEGVERDDSNAALWEYLGNVALAKGTARTDGVGEEAAPEQAVSDPESVRLAVEAYDRVLTLRGDSINPAMVQNLIAANMELGDLDKALQYSERGLQLIEAAADVGGGEETAGGEEAAPSQTKEQILAGIHSVRADVFSRMEDYSQGVSEMELAMALDPELPNAYWKRGNLRLKAGDSDGAISDFRAAVDAGSDPDQIANSLFATGYQEHFQKGQYNQAIALFEVAGEFAQSPQTAQQIHFFMAYGFYQQASAIDAANAQNEACGPAQRALRAFQQVLPHLGQAGNYQAQSQGQIREAVDVQIYRQEQIIRAACN